MKKKVALVCIAKEEGPYLQEWIDYHLKLGFDDIHIFQNDWRWDSYVEHEQVHMYEYDGKTYHSEEPIHVRNVQARCYTEFCRDYHEQYEWVAAFDVDEYLVLKQTDNVKEFITAYDAYTNVVIDWVTFGDSGHKTFTDDNTSVVNRFTMRRRNPDNQFKSFCKLGPEVNHDIHMAQGMWVTTEFIEGMGGHNVRPHIGVAQLNHYFTKTLPEFLQKRERGNACGSGENGKRAISDFDSNNDNEVEDTLAKDFFNKTE
jgi:hypothetical protein